jgi:hypothetical protein
MTIPCTEIPTAFNQTVDPYEVIEDKNRREIYGRDGGPSLHCHHTRTYFVNGTGYVLDRNMDDIVAPPYVLHLQTNSSKTFNVEGPSIEPYWGKGLTWAQAEQKIKAYLSALLHSHV